MGDTGWVFTHCIMVLDYPTLLNTRKLMVVHAKPGILRDLNDDFERYIAAKRRQVEAD